VYSTVNRHPKRQVCPLTDDQAAEMLRDARMAGLVKLHCGKGFTGDRQQWAVSDCR